MSGKSYTVKGVAPPSFRGLDKLVPTDAWIPATDEDPQAEAGQRDFRDFELVARLRNGVTGAQASTELGVIGARFAAEYPQTIKVTTD